MVFTLNAVSDDSMESRAENHINNCKLWRRIIFSAFRPLSTVSKDSYL